MNKHVGETKMMRNGHMATIIGGEKANDLTVRFDTGNIREHIRYANFNLGNVGLIATVRTKLDDYIGQKKIMNNGQEATIIKMDDYRHITVQFDNGICTDASIDRFKDGTIALPRQVRHIGETVMQKNGHMAELIRYENKNNVSIRFDNGIVRDNISYYIFLSGQAGLDGNHFKGNNRENTVYPQKNGHNFTITKYISASDITGVFDTGDIRHHIAFNDIVNGTVLLKPRCAWKEEYMNATFLMQCGLHITVLSIEDYEHVHIRFDETGEELTVSRKQIDERRCLPLGLSSRTRNSHDFCGFHVKGNPVIIDNIPFYTVTCDKTGEEMFLNPVMMASMRSIERAAMFSAVHFQCIANSQRENTAKEREREREEEEYDCI